MTFNFYQYNNTAVYQRTIGAMCSFIEVLIYCIWISLLVVAYESLKNKGEVQLGNPKSGRVVAYGRGRLHESFLLQSLSQFKRGFIKVFVNCSRNQSQSLSRVVARRASTVYLPGFMKTRLANILLFPQLPPS